MHTESTTTKLLLQCLGGRVVVGRFDGGEAASDADGVFLRKVEHQTRILGRLSECFTDRRISDRIEHSVEALVKQRVHGLRLGCEKAHFLKFLLDAPPNASDSMCFSSRGASPKSRLLPLV